MAEIIRADLQFEAVFRHLPSRRHHDAGIVDQHIQIASCTPHALTKRGDGGEASEIEQLEADRCTRDRCADRVHRLLPFRGIAAGKDDVAPCARQCQAAFISKATGAGDDETPSGLRGHIGGSPIRFHDRAFQVFRRNAASAVGSTVERSA
jgi:hypothetical protein